MRTTPILMQAYSKSQLLELIRVATRLQNTGRYRVRVCSDNPSPEVQSILEGICSASGVTFFRPAEPPEAPARLTGRRRFRLAIWRWIRRHICEPGLVGSALRKYLHPQTEPENLKWLAGIFDAIVEADLKELARYQELFRTMKPSLLVIAEDGIGASAATMAAAQESDVPILVVPYEFSNREQLIKARRPNGPEMKAAEEVLIRRFPQWVVRAESPILTALPPHMALAREALGMAPLLPCTVHGGPANKIAVESKRMHDHYVSEGISQSKLADTGSIALDDIMKAMERDDLSMNAFARETKRVSGRTSILCAFVPDYVSSTSDRCDFSSYRDLVDYWIDTLQGLSNSDVTFQAHPATAAVDRAYIESRVALSDENITALIARCDVVVTSVSSTIRWAIAAKKPVVNYDVYRFRYPDYIDAPGVVGVETRGEFAEAIGNIVHDDHYYLRLIQRLASEAQVWGILDGKAHERVLALVDSMTAVSHSR